MSGIVIELQREALNSYTDITSLLRKAYLIARKLQLKDFQAWVQSELNGYDVDSQCEVPNYREVRGELRGFNPVRGWIPVMIPDDTMYNALTSRKIAQSIPDIISLLKSENGIIDEGLVFSEEGKQQAETPKIVNYTNNFFGNVDNTQLQQGTTSSEQTR